MKRGKANNKRGLSPAVSSVLLIMLVLVLAAMIFLWARGFISEQIEKFGQPIDSLCSSVDFEVAKISGSGGDMLEVVNRGNIDIYHLDIKMFDAEGNSEVEKFKFNVDAGKSAIGQIYLRMDNGITPEKITVYPALIGTVQGKPQNKIFTCTEAGQTLIL